jgi:glycine cleavage system aminomethyltransferase T
MQSLSDYFQTRALEYIDLAPGITVPAHFGDWEQEYWSVRRHSGLFDFSFMHTIEVVGPSAIAVLELFQCRLLQDLAIGSIRYSFIVDQEGYTDLDITIWRLDDNRFWLIAGRPIKDRLTQLIHGLHLDLEISEKRFDYNILAVQGPHSQSILANTLACQMNQLPEFFTFKDISFMNTPIRIARLGYTGEVGYELFVPREIAKQVWLKLLDLNEGLSECGFIAANCLRIEAGFLLFANELQPPRLLAELGFERFIRGGEQKPTEKMVGIAFGTIQPHLDPEYSADLEHFVVPTSRCYSPQMQCEIGLGFYDAAIAQDKKKALTRELEPVEIMKLPFYRNDKP